jgi:MoaA/NifB/PqqE/SkfB family radical SAM enzyme
MMTQYYRTGLYVREDTNLGILIYSPFTGLLFSCLEEKDNKRSLINWLNGRTDVAPNDLYAKSIGAGWCIPKNKAQYPREHYLSKSQLRLQSYKPDYPIIINWLITGNCMCDCKYCYAKDLMAPHQHEPSTTEIKQIANNILSYKPLAIVLTGGDPLISPNIEVAIKLLHGKAGIIVDTNGFAITKRHLALFKKYGVFVRVSLDSEKPKINANLRPLKNNVCSLSAAIQCINMCLEKCVNVGVQTVVTKNNMSDLQSLGHKLYRLGITNWRLQMLAYHSGFHDYKDYIPNKKRFVETILPTLGQKNRTGWDESMSIQVADNMKPNAVLLVSPSGEFMTEMKEGKVFIDPKNKTRPSINRIKNGALDLDAHTDRYMNLGPSK